MCEKMWHVKKIEKNLFSWYEAEKKINAWNKWEEKKQNNKLNKKKS